MAVLESGRTSWCRLLDALRRGPADDAAAITAAQLRDVIERIIAAGHWSQGAPDLLIVADAGYETTRYGTATAQAWDRLHPRLTRRSAWITDQNPELPVLHGLVDRLTVERLPGGRDPDPVWLWSSHPGADPGHVDQLWWAYLRRFDLEHTFRLMKQTLGWTVPKLRDPTSADLWTGLIIAAHTQLWLARPAAQDLRCPWERPLPSHKLTPARVRRGFGNIRARVPRHTPGKSAKRAETLDQHYGPRP